MSFENFPYTNFHELNLDWILQKLKEAYSSENPPDYPVTSVNGQTGNVIIAIPSTLVQSVNGETGDVILYTNPLTQFPATDEVRWNLFRICDGTEKGIEFDENSAKRIAGTRRILIYDEDNPPDYPVTSVNGQTGDVEIVAGVQSVNGKTGNVVTPFVNPNTDILALDSNSPSILWGISRNVAGGNVALYITSGGGTPQAFIRYIPEGGQAINLPLLTNADIPENAGVVSVNTKTGAVTLYGTDIKINDASNVSLSDQLAINAQNMEAIMEIIADSESDVNLWEQGSLSASNGWTYENNTKLRTIDYVNSDCTNVRTISANILLRLYAWNAENTFIGIYQTSNEFLPSSSNIAELRNIDLSFFKTRYPGYKYKIVAHYANDAVIPVEQANNIIFDTSRLVNIEENEAIIRNDISALQTKDATHDQQISALQSTDNTINQQISALQAKDTTHDQQISALQETTNSYSQQIAELYSRTNAYLVTIENVNYLPLRYPVTGAEDKIKSDMVCISMDLSNPACQIGTWSINTQNGYFTILGDISGTTNITLYLMTTT